MKLRVRNHILLIMIIGVFAIADNQVMQAENKPDYTIDLAPTVPPDFSDYQTVEISDVNQLKTNLADNKTKVIYVLQNDIELTKQLSIQGNKAINLNGHTLSGIDQGFNKENGSLLIPEKSTTTQFKIYNGNISGGPEYKFIDGIRATTTAFLNVSFHVQADVVLEDITYNSSTEGGSFFHGLSSNVFTLGTVNINTYCTNIRAGNMTFLGDFNGIAFGAGDQNIRANGSGGVNLSFDGKFRGFRNPYNAKKIKAESGETVPVSQPMSTTNGDRRIYIGPDSHVVLKNTNFGKYSEGEYNNNIANFSTITIDGSLIAEAEGSTLMTSATMLDLNEEPGSSYKSQVGTHNGKANINVNENATFKVSSLNKSGNKGALYAASTNLYAYNPKVFDMRYFGTGQFFYSFSAMGLEPSNIYLYDLNVAVWNKAQKGIGDPALTWKNVDSLSVENFWYSSEEDNSSGFVTSSNANLQSKFAIDKYSRISNNLKVPKLIVDDQFMNDDISFLNNGDNVFSGSSCYTIEDEDVPDTVTSGATVILTIDDKAYSTKSDDSGRWKFDDLDLTNVKAGTVATLNLTDTDFRTAPEINVIIKDTIPPVVSSKLIEVTIGDTTALQNPKDGILSAKDETTSEANLVYEFVTPEEERKEMINKLGVYNVDIKVSDEAGNTTSVTAPVIVYPKGEKIEDSYVTGNDFTIDYNTWTGLTEDQKRNLIMEKGQVKGYQINDNTVTDVTDDPTKLLINLQTTTWEPNQTYPVIATVGKYKKIINVTIVPNTVKMTIKQIYQGTDTPIYSDLESKTPVDNTQSIEVPTGDELKNVINKEISDENFTLNYEGYDTQEMTNYKIYQNGTEVIPTPTEVPSEAFTLVYEYQGQLKFKKTAKNLDFGSIEITAENTETALSDSSDTTISIVNTIQNSTWKLKASLPEGITKRNNNKSFWGSIFYKNTDGTETRLGMTSTEIEKQVDDKLYSELSLKNKDKVSGLYLHQDVGNLKGSYTGTMVWTLEDTP